MGILNDFAVHHIINIGFDRVFLWFKEAYYIITFPKITAAINIVMKACKTTTRRVNNSIQNFTRGTNTPAKDQNTLVLLRLLLVEMV